MNNAGLHSCLYVGDVIHQRLKPRRHRLRYRVFSLLLDLDEIDALDAGLRLFSRNRFNLYTFYDRDFANRGVGPLRTRIEQALAGAGVDTRGGAIRLLCYPRLLGYAFNPLSTYFCYGRDGALAAILYEVSNTFGERHSYLVPLAGDGALPLRHAAAKRFYVSPFFDVAGDYHFRVTPPGQHVAIAINYRDAEGLRLHAAFRGTRHRLTDRALLSHAVRLPLMTLKVIGGIHWEALKLWLKGVPLVHRPPPPREPITVVDPSPL